MYKKFIFTICFSCALLNNALATNNEVLHEEHNGTHRTHSATQIEKNQRFDQFLDYYEGYTAQNVWLRRLDKHFGEAIDDYVSRFIDNHGIGVTDVSIMTSLIKKFAQTIVQSGKYHSGNDKLYALVEGLAPLCRVFENWQNLEKPRQG